MNGITFPMRVPTTSQGAFKIAGAFALVGLFLYLSGR